MQATIVHRSLLHHTAFSLLPNRARTGAGKVGALYGVIIVPFLLFGIAAFCVLEMRGTQLLIALAFSLVLLVNMYFFIVRTRHLHETFLLRIDLDEISLCRDRTELCKASLHDVRIEQLCWGTEKLPAIQLYGPGFPRLLIGHGGDQIHCDENTRVHQMTDYWISSEKDWQELLRILN